MLDFVLDNRFTLGDFDRNSPHREVYKENTRLETVKSLWKSLSPLSLEERGNSFYFGVSKVTASLSAIPPGQVTRKTDMFVLRVTEREGSKETG